MWNRKACTWNAKSRELAQGDEVDRQLAATMAFRKVLAVQIGRKDYPRMLSDKAGETDATKMPWPNFFHKRTLQERS